ncbi:MAG: coenzyme F420-0:L-glutamate ligase [Synergistaceae bacterium]|nr:coenzyme F420-0:L-glutamate ligase [Synergistaceae bacterium]
MRCTGTTVRGIRMPIVRKGDNLIEIITEYLLFAAESEPFHFKDRDVVGVTESFFARSQGNIVSIDEVAEDVARKVPKGDIAVAFPILSRNRFLPMLNGIVKGIPAPGKIRIYTSYPSDEVGNRIIDPASFYERKSKLASECFDESTWEKTFGRYKHAFTGVDYVELYRGPDPDRIEVWFTNNPLDILKRDRNVLIASIHARAMHRDILSKGGANWLCDLTEICNAPIHEGSGYNPDYGLLGSNYSSDSTLKLFPRDCKAFVNELQAALLRKTGKNMQVLIYGDGAFKDPVCGIWELADPVVSPGYTDGLEGTPSEIKLKLVADSAGNATASEARRAVAQAIEAKRGSAHAIDAKLSLGTTPRRYPDLLGSLCDLASGSGDKGTPVIHISGYFDSYIDE